MTRPVARALWRQLNDVQRRELAAALDESVTRREARLNPLVGDIDDGGTDDRLDRLLESVPQAFGTARLLSLPRYCGADDFCVRVTEGACRADERSPRGRELARARFLAWPYARATRVHVPSQGASERSASELRRRSDVALVLDGADVAIERDELDVLRLFERREALIRLESADSSDVSPPRAETPWTPRPDELLVIPTLESVARHLDE